MTTKCLDCALVSSGSPHPTTKRCAEAIDCDFFKISSSSFSILGDVYQAILTYMELRRSRYDLILIESALSMIPSLLYRLENPEAIIVHRGNAGEYNLILGKEPVRWLRRHVITWLMKQTDGVVAISNLVKNQVEQAYPDKPVEVAHTFVYDTTFYDIEPFIPDKPEDRSFLFVGNYLPPYDHKDIEGLISVFEDLHEEGFGADLHVLGDRTRELRSEVTSSKINLHGYMSPKSFYKESTFYVHNAKFEAGGTVVLEAMASGLIPIVSDKTGNKDFLPSKNIYDYESIPALKQALQAWYNVDPTSLRQSSNHMKEIVSDQGPETGPSDFERAIISLIERV
jgi:glycosyltransferase involved in cell wall biosynthesis